ncbi:hypothetical protein QEG98_28435 [Myxococcus sp. MxC21-1]|uniref:hypothetical protein n=1 Tax=Myxococcus sp. MxC21-1 TaxID=3041439 RepID=UPI00292FEC61|nr:hypothetical protein [Myxococcus sp. MxC21-1]WNZ59935.1 hypothetical protein QEG98_28435 [Myxococcus sp. MxC21-1]
MRLSVNAVRAEAVFPRPTSSASNRFRMRRNMSAARRWYSRGGTFIWNSGGW